MRRQFTLPNLSPSLEINIFSEIVRETIMEEIDVQ
jgi:hypothetical protein